MATQSPRVVPGYRQTAIRNPALPLQRRPLTRSELTAPHEQAERLAQLGADIAGHGASQAIGQLMHLRLEVVDEDGAPIGGTMVEMWQANAAGRYIHPNDDDHAPVDANFYGAARVLTDESGVVEIRTIKPGGYPVPDSGHWWRPPHIHFSVWGRVWLSRLVTQMFFPGEPLNAAGPHPERDPERRRARGPRLSGGADERRAVERARLRAPARRPRPRARRPRRSGGG